VAGAELQGELLSSCETLGGWSYEWVGKRRA